MSMSNSSKTGWLYKQGGRIKTWKRRWFQISGTNIHYYAKQNAEEKGFISLSEATDVCVAPECKKQPALKVVTKKRIYYMQADTESDRNEWIEAFQKARHWTTRAQTMVNVAPPTINENQPKIQIGLDDFDYFSVLGRGTYGKVQLVKYKKDGKIYAMKSMSKQLLQEHEQVEQSLIEKDILVKTRYPFLVSAHYTFQTPDSIYLIMDYVPGGELFKRLKEEGRFQESRAKLYAAEIMLALGHLHSLNFIFRDLKPENILIDDNGHIKITDFGLVKSLMNSSDSTTTFCGTPEYIAPEMIQQQPYTKSIDWWSFGILVFEMLTGLPPFYDSNVSKMYRKILNDDIEFPSFMSPELCDFISKLLDRDPQTRLGASERDVEELKEHPFFYGYDWDAILEKRVQPEWVPQIGSPTDVSNFDEDFTLQREGPSLYNAAGISNQVQTSFANFTSATENGL